MYLFKHIYVCLCDHRREAICYGTKKKESMHFIMIFIFKNIYKGKCRLSYSVSYKIFVIELIFCILTYCFIQYEKLLKRNVDK